MDLSNPLTLILSIAAALAILALTIWLLVFLTRPSAGRDVLRMAIPLNCLARRNRQNHVFLGFTLNSRRLASQILQEWKKEKRKKNQGYLVFVDLNPRFNKSAERDLRSQLGSTRIVVLNGNLVKTDGASLAASLHLRGLQPWLANPRTSLYLFSEKREENLALLSLTSADRKIKAKVFYYAPDPNGLDALIVWTGRRVRLLNPYQMTYMYVKQNRPEWMPIQYVNKALDKEGRPAGYVLDGLHAGVIGFGNAGQEALRFLYEFGCFVGKDGQKAPMSIDVFDPDISRHVGTFLQSAPALKGEEALRWHAYSTGSAEFWDAFEKDSRLNYLIVAMDDGPRNIETGIALLASAARTGKDLSRMLILVGNGSDKREYRDLLDTYNAVYCPSGVKVLHSIGLPDQIWNADVISGRRFKKAALLYNEQQVSLGKEEPWEERKRRLGETAGHSPRSLMELQRLQALDISHALFASTLLSLTPEGIQDEDNARYLLAQEQLHRSCALAVMGGIEDGKSSF